MRENIFLNLFFYRKKKKYEIFQKSKFLFVKKKPYFDFIKVVMDGNELKEKVYPPPTFQGFLKGI